MSERVAFYTSEETKEDIERAAERAGESVSEWVGKACKQRLEREALEGMTDQYRVEQRLLSLVEESADRVADEIADEVAEEVAIAVLRNLAEANNLPDEEQRREMQQEDDGGWSR